MAFFSQGRDPVISSLKVTRIVMWVCCVVVGFRFPFPFLRCSLFLPGNPWAPSSHCSYIRRTSLEDRFLFCLPPLSSKDQFQDVQEVGPGPGIIVRGDSCQRVQNATDPRLLGGLQDVSPDWDQGEENTVPVWRVGM